MHRRMASPSTNTLDQWKALFENVLKCYTTKNPAELRRLYSETYSEKATFVDPFVCASPRREALLQFLALQKLFSTITAETTSQPARNANGTLACDVNFDYVWNRNSSLSRWLLPEVTHLVATIELELDSAGKVLHHEDKWHVPKVPALPIFLRSMNTAATNAVFRLLGWEKEEVEPSIATKQE